MRSAPVRRRPVWPVAGAVLLVLLMALLAVGGEGRVAVIGAATIAAIAVGVTAWALMRTRAHRREYEAQLAGWAGERAAHAERLRIARELHDLVSHGLGLITVRAASAVHVGTADGHRDALADIERIGRATTTELRRMLGVLRDAATVAARGPVETVDDLPGIVQTATRTGLTVRLDVANADAISAGAQLVTCAIVREALTNTARHAGPTSATVEVRRCGATVVVRVSDAGPAPRWRPQPGAGHGLAGLRERVEALGGELRAEPVDSGFHLVARIPDGPA